MAELTGVGDFNRDGFVDLVARQTSNGNLYLYPGRGLGFSPRVLIGAGWGGLRDVTGVGDFDRDGFTDVLAVQTSTGKLFRYLGNGAALTSPTQIGSGWGSQRPLL
jgi:hypothetical protein